MALRSWVTSANDSTTGFPLENLPYGVFRNGNRNAIGVAIGEQVLDLGGCARQGLLQELSAEAREACSQETLNALMSLGPESWSSVRRQITALLDADQAGGETQAKVQGLLSPMQETEMQLPAEIGDYTD